MGRIAVFVWVILSAGIAAAGEIRGVVLDSMSGVPVPSATVTVASSQRQLTVPTDAQGHYAVEELPPGEYSVLIAYGGVHVQHAHVDVVDGKTTALEDKLEVPAELITVRERAVPDKPATPPEQKHSSSRTLPYSDEAFDKDVWAVAWLLLDVDAEGRVTAAKFYRRPGYGLDEIALDAAWKLSFTPALDAQGKPARSWVMYKMEWPPLSLHTLFLDTETSLNPRKITRLPCADSGQPLNMTMVYWFYRNCAKPDEAVGAREAWKLAPPART